MSADRRERIAIAWVVIAALLLGGTAKAADAKPYPPPAEGWGAAIWKTAERVWGGPPPNCATLTVEYDRALIHHPHATGEATQPTIPGAHCEARIAPMKRGLGEYVCEVALHEYGHLMGEGHTPDPRALMFGAPWADTVPWEYVGHPACWKFGHWQQWQSYLASELAAGD